MSLELCQICNEDSTPWKHINGHVCQDCYYKDKWISVKNQLPDDRQRVLAWYNCKGVCAIFLFWYSNNEFNDILYDHKKYEKDFIYPTEYVTHWMPLPEAPND